MRLDSHAIDLHPWSIVLSGLNAGLVAGLILGLLLLAFASPLISDAEEILGEHGEGHGGQRTVSTIIGTLIVGSVYGLILATLLCIKSRARKTGVIIRGILYGSLGFLLISLIPALAFPPNPPGVEARASVAVRQTWWLVIILFEILGILIYKFILRRSLSINESLQKLLALAAFGAVVSIPFLVGLPNEVETGSIPATLVFNFRLISISILLVFWLVLGLLAGWTYNWLRPQISSPVG